MKIVFYFLFFLMLISFINLHKITIQEEKISNLGTKKKLSRNSKNDNKPSENEILRAKKLRAMNMPTSPNPKKPKTVPFNENPATNENLGINSLGETGFSKKDKIALHDFPYILNRCDQLVYVPVTFINNEDDYRVRKKGKLTISVHLTNLFYENDGQKLIQQVNNSEIKGDTPCPLPGARGCVKISGIPNQKNMLYCVENKAQVDNIIYIYKEFKRCRLGDNLQPIPPQILKALEEMCKAKKNVVSLIKSKIFFNTLKR